jgi:hypothetical protein
VMVGGGGGGSGRGLGGVLREEREGEHLCVLCGVCVCVCVCVL